jgi:hypothetical protein
MSRFLVGAGSYARSRDPSRTSCCPQLTFDPASRGGWSDAFEPPKERIHCVHRHITERACVEYCPLPPSRTLAPECHGVIAHGHPRSSGLLNSPSQAFVSTALIRSVGHKATPDPL